MTAETHRVTTPIGSLVSGTLAVLTASGELVFWQTPAAPQEWPPFLVCSIGSRYSAPLHLFVDALLATRWRSLDFQGVVACGRDIDDSMWCTPWIQPASGWTGAAPVSLRLLGRGAQLVVVRADAACGMFAGTPRCWQLRSDRTSPLSAAATLQLGTGARFWPPVQPPLTANGSRDLRAVASGGGTTCILDADGVACWGDTAWGQAGPGQFVCTGSRSRACQLEPARISLAGVPVSVVVTGVSSCALLEDGDVFCWGVVPGPRFPRNPASSASSACWIGPHRVLRGVVQLAKSEGGALCALSRDHRRVACFGGGWRSSREAPAGTVRSPWLAFDWERAQSRAPVADQ